MTSFGYKLQALRKKRNLKRAKLASAVGISAQNCLSYETDKSMPGIEELVRFANFFDCSVDYLIGRTDITTFIENDAKLKYLVDVYSSLEPAYRELLKEQGLMLVLLQESKRAEQFADQMEI